MVTPKNTENNSLFGMGVSAWISICVFVCIWFLNRFITGRRQMKRNLHQIEEGLKRMQEEIEKRQRENSISYGQDLEQFVKEHTENIERIKQKVSVDVWKMIFSSCSYLGLAFAAWVLIKLVYACFWLPKYLQKEEQSQHDDEISKDENKQLSGNKDEEELSPQDKKND